ncbi:MAG: hypothetical protein ACJ77K_18830 [Bacteroidia bacterium]|jgi:hypothetical protein
MNLLRYLKCHILFAIGLPVVFLSCNSGQNEKSNGPGNTDSLKTVTEVKKYDPTENLKLATGSIITRSESYFFSNSKNKDLFRLTIAPGPVKNSEAKFEIITPDSAIAYSVIFSSYYFITGIYEPDTIPTTGGQEAYEKYMEHYWKSITPAQYEAYFYKNVNGFFDAVQPLLDDRSEELNAWKEQVTDQAFFNEALADTTIRLFDITCFDCDEGGSIIGFSKKQNKAITFIEHD